MSLGDDLARALPGLRGEAESRFTETFKAYRVERILDEETGVYDDTEVAVYATVRGQVKYPTLTVAERSQGGQAPAIQDVVVKVAVGATPNVTVDTMWRCTASTADSSLVGREYRTKGIPQAGQVTTWRYPVESVS